MFILQSKVNHVIYPGISTHREEAFREVLHPDRIGIRKCWFLGRGENRSTWIKTSRSREENQQYTQPTYDAETGNRTRATLVGDECFHHCANPAPLKMLTIPCKKLYLYLRFREQT